MKFKNPKKSKKIFSILIILFLLLTIYLLFEEQINSLFSNSSSSKNQNLYDYKTFYSLIQEEKILDATIKPNKIIFHLKSDLPNLAKTETSFEKSENQNKKPAKTATYIVENPNSPTLKEFLLLNNVKVKEEKSGEEIFSKIMDLIFYLIFFVIIGFVFVKFVSPNTFKVVHKTGKTFKDVVGMDSLKKDMLQIMDIMKNPSVYEKKGIRMPKGILLEGKPGNGKTLFAKALAGEAKVNFIPAKATDFESMFMAIGPMKVKLLFKKARAKAPCIVFIDEFDGIGTRRNYSGSAIETENTRIVTALLNELDGFQANQGILVLAATNSISALDEALIRPGRFDAKVTVPFPDENSRKELIKMYSANKDLDTECSVEKLAVLFNGFSCAKIESVLNRAALLSKQSQKAKISLEEIKFAIKD